jgi:hypothetical protein
MSSLTDQSWMPISFSNSGCVQEEIPKIKIIARTAKK